MRRRLLLTLAALLASCSAPKCSSEHSSVEIEQALELTAHIPRSADATLFMGRLNERVVLAGALDAATPGAAASDVVCASLEPIGLKPCAAASWAARGFDLARPVALVVDRGVLGVVGLRLKDADAFRTWWYDGVEKEAGYDVIARARVGGWSVRTLAGGGAGFTMAKRGDAVALAMSFPGASSEEVVARRVVEWLTLERRNTPGAEGNGGCNGEAECAMPRDVAVAGRDRDAENVRRQLESVVRGEPAGGG